MNIPHLLTSLVVVIHVCGCQAPSGGTAGAQASADGRGDLDPKLAFVPLADIPRPVPPKSNAATGAAADGKTGAGVQDETSDRARKQIDKARELLAVERFTESQQRLSRALRYSPNSFDAHLLMGEVALQTGNSARAAEHLDQAKALRPQAAQLYYLLGRAHVLHKRWDDAIAALLTLPQCPDADQQRDLVRVANYTLSQALRERGYLKAASQALSAFLAAEPHTPGSPYDVEAQDVLLSAHIQLADLHERLDEPQAAARILDAAFKLDPTQHAFLERMAQAHLKADNAEAAALAARRYFEASGQGLDLLVSIRTNAGQRQALLGDLQALAGHYPERYAVIERLVDLYVQDGALEDGAAALQAFISANPDNLRASTALAGIRALQGRWSDSAQLIDSAVLRDAAPGALVDGWLQRVRRGGDVAAALQSLSAGLDAGSLGAGAAYATALLALAEGQEALAQRALEQSISNAPGLIVAHDALGSIHLRKHDWDAALVSADAMLSADADDYRGHRLEGLAALGLDRYDDALDALNTAVRINRHDIPSMEALVEAYELSNKPLKAISQYRAILEADGMHVAALEALFENALRERDETQAGEYLGRLERADPVTFRRVQALLAARQSQDWAAYQAELQEILKNDPDHVATRLDLARQLASDENFKDAHAQVDHALRAEPDNTAGLLLRTALAVQQFEYDQAIATLRRLLQIHPHRTMWQLTLVQAMLNDHRFAEALETIDGFLASDALDEGVRRRLRRDAILCLAIDYRAEQALQRVQTWMASEPNDSDYRLLWLNLSRLAGQSARAVPQIEAWYQTVRESSEVPATESARTILVNTYLAADRLDDAEVVSLSWLNDNPGDPDATNRLLNVLQEKEQYDAAIELVDATLLVERAPRLREFFEQVRVEIYVEAGRHDIAARLIRERLEGIETDWFMRRQLVWILIESGRTDEALRELRLWNEMIPRVRDTDLPGTREDYTALGWIHSLMSVCFQTTGQDSLALQEQVRRWELEPGSAGTNNDLGYQWADAGIELEKAEAMVRRAVRANPREAAYIDSMAWVLYKLGRFEEAWFWLERAVRSPMGDWDRWLESSDHDRGGSDPVIQDHMGDTAWRLNRRDEAVAHWTLAAKLAREQDGYRSPDVLSIIEQAAEKARAVEQDQEPACAAVVGSASE